MTKTIIAGPRDFPGTVEHIEEAVMASGFRVDFLIDGGASGVDNLAIWWALYSDVRYRVYNANWELYDKAAGHQRNVLMATAACFSLEHFRDCSKARLIVVRHKISPGTCDMISIAKEYSIETYIYEVDL